MAEGDPLSELLSVEFEVFGKVQGCYFPKFTRDLCNELGIVGWVKNSPCGTIMGKMQGPKPYVEQMQHWLTTIGSPGSEIHHCELTNIESIARLGYRGFAIRF
ncbi:acylphosphatase-2 [Venturia canescens]|uniref:acylphosphatase-2 n=1 Tax=Venturia canescens TaxID=32260 RepID=UPI001C9CE4D0|nr:acylphosphatase-2 [Venturia canescens]XP_043278062.1 acylphosphatase-2 [Venturia canescens]